MPIPGPRASGVGVSPAVVRRPFPRRKVAGLASFSHRLAVSPVPVPPDQLSDGSGGGPRVSQCRGVDRVVGEGSRSRGRRGVGPCGMCGD